MSSKRTILFKVWKFPVLSETFIVAQIITAIKCGFKVNILVEDIMDLKIHEDLIKKYRLSEKIIVEDYRIPLKKWQRYFKAFFIAIQNFRHFFKLIKFVNLHERFELRHIYKFHFFSKLRHFDIVHVQYGTNGRPLDLLKKINFFPPKLIVSFHGHDLFFPINGIIKNNGYYDNLFEQADLLIANTNYLKELLIHLGASNQKIRTIPVAVDTNFFKKINILRSTEEEVNLITVGRLEVFKGQHLGISCINSLKKKGYNLKYTLIGTGSREAILKQTVGKKKLTKEVVFMGKMSQKEIRNALQGKDIFLMTSITDPDYGVETQGLVTAEAQACGLPVIAFDSGGVKYTVLDGKSGYVVPEGDVDAMVEKIETLLKDSELRSNMSQEAVRFIEENFSQNHLNKVWKKTYESLIA